MKLLKIFGIVAGIHLFALILIFANPGCSTSSKSAKRTDSTATGSSDAVVSVPNLSSNQYQDQGLATDHGSTQMNAFDPTPAPSATPIAFNNDVSAQSSDIRYSPTRPNTPVASALNTEPVADVIPATTYTVVRGDSLWSIAKRNHLSVAELSASNNLRATSTLQLGQKLIIPGKSAAASAQTSASEPVAAKATPAPAAKSSGESVTHVVKPGETLGAIARKYQVKVGDIATANNVTDPAKIRPGQELVIPGWKAPAPKPAAVATKTPASSPSFPVQSPVDTTPSPVQPSPVQPYSNPIIFAPPSADKPLDEGFKNDTKDVPVIQVEESGEGPQ